MNSYGLIPKILNKIKDAKTPPRFTMDFLGTNLGFNSGSARPFVGFAKRLGLLTGPRITGKTIMDFLHTVRTND